MTEKCTPSTLAIAVLALFVLAGFRLAMAAEAGAPAGPEVTVMTVSPQSARLSLDIVGEVKAMREVELRPRVTGTITAIAFEPGREVKEKDLLFTIDPVPYEVALANARAGLAQAQASLSRVRQDIERYKPLLPDNAIPRQVYDQALAQAAQEEAVVAGRQAAVDKARLDLDYTRVTSPLTGRVGLQKVEVGTLVTAGQTPLVVVSTLDPVVVYFSISENEYLNLAKRQEPQRKTKKKEEDSDQTVDLLLADGDLYEEKGSLDYIDPTIDPASGTLTLRAVFANPKRLLRAGMNSRVRVYYDELEAALLVPQKAVTETLGRYFLTVLDDSNKVELRSVKLGARQGDLWLVEEGLRAGERIVVDGIQKARPGMVVTPRALPGS
jgi:membrane fusion protein (multidrug efflux system)